MKRLLITKLVIAIVGILILFSAAHSGLAQDQAHLRITQVVPLGAQEHPFDLLEIRFNRPVQDGTFSLADVALGGPEGSITPRALTRVTAQSYQLDNAGLTGRGIYWLDIGTDIQDIQGTPLDQDGDGTPGEAGQDRYRAALVSTDLTISVNDTTYQGTYLVIAGARASITGFHNLAGLGLFQEAVVGHAPPSAEQEQGLRLSLRDSLWIDSSSRIDVSGRGYGTYTTVGNTTEGGATGSSGGSYGGLGVDRHGSSNLPYGDPKLPNHHGSGGAGERGTGAPGGGLVHITAAKAVVDGAILANGADGIECCFRTGGGGSGGSILLNVGSLTGSGRISANGGNGISDSGSGGGGRVAVYTWGQVSIPRASITASGGTSQTGAGESGSVFISHEAALYWVEPPEPFLHDIATLRWLALGVDPSKSKAEVTATGPAGTLTLGKGLDILEGISWDTTAIPEGVYELSVTLREGATSQVIAEATRTVLVNNSVEWHRGRILSAETWTRDRVHLVQGDLRIAPNVQVVVQPGTVVKFTPGARIIVEDAGALEASATASQSTVFTALADDEAGGDTNLDGSRSMPRAGDWGGIITQGAGRLRLSGPVALRYGTLVHSGTLEASETWPGDFVHWVPADLVVPQGVTVTVQPGAIIKLGTHRSIEVQSGGKLLAQGTTAQPIIFTSWLDDSVGGDTNRDGNGTEPSPGDWRWLHVHYGEAVLDHTIIRYGGGTASGNWDGTGAVRTTGSASLTVANSFIQDAFFDGLLAWGGQTRVVNTVVSGAERGISAHPESRVEVINSTLDDNRIGLLVHGGTLTVANTIVSNSLEAGIQFDFGTLESVRYTNVWSPQGSGSVNYVNTTDLTGANGNISADPRYKNRAQGNYRLGYRSPAIDAADGALAPRTDLMGAPRYDDPRTPNTGTLAAGGAYADMGAYEFVETAESDVDLVVTSVHGPGQVTAGETVTVRWTVLNRGTGLALGPWHDSIYLVPVTGGEPVLAGEVLVGQGAELGPGATFTASTKVRVPGSTVGDHLWQVVANTDGDIFEGKNQENNARLSSETVVLDLPELVVGGEDKGRFTQPGEARWYKLTPAGGQDVVVSLDLEGSSGVTELYIGRGYVPSAQRFEARSRDQASPDARVAIASATSQTYYVVAYPRSLSSPADFTISAKAMDFVLESVSPTAAGNAGPVTLKVRGGRLGKETRYTLRSAGGASYSASAVHLGDSTTVYATFDLKGASVGAYDLVATGEGGATRTLRGALTVSAGTGPALTVKVVVPATVRTGRPFEGYVTYKNVGDADMASPLLVLIADGRARLSLGPEEPAGDSLQLMAVSFEGPAGVLRPGQEGRIKFSATTSQAGSVEIKALYKDADSLDPIDWRTVEAQVRPQGAEGGPWEQAWTGFVARAGNTWGGYVSVLANEATILARQGGRFWAVRDVLTSALRRASGSQIGNISGTVYLEDQFHPLADALVLLASGDGTQAGAAITRADGSFSLTLPPGTYTVDVPGYAPGAASLVTVPSTGGLTGLELVVHRGGAITGAVFSRSDGAPLAEVPVMAASEDGKAYFTTTGPQGGYSLAGLAEGTYTVTVGGQRWATQSRAGVEVTHGGTAGGVNFSLDAPASVKGVVVRASDGAPISGAVVVMQSSTGRIGSARSDQTGQYEVGRLSPGRYTVTVAAPGYATTRLAELTVRPGDTLTAPTASLARGATLKVEVRDTSSQPLEGVAVVLADAQSGQVVSFGATDAQGLAVLQDLAAGNYRVHVLAAPFPGLTSEVTLAEGATVTRQYAAQAMFRSGTSGTGRPLASPLPRPVADDPPTFPEFMATSWGDLYHYLIGRVPEPAHHPSEALLFPIPPAKSDCPPAVAARLRAIRAIDHMHQSYLTWEDQYNNFRLSLTSMIGILAMDTLKVASDVYALQLELPLYAGSLGELATAYKLQLVIALVGSLPGLINGVAGIAEMSWDTGADVFNNLNSLTNTIAGWLQRFTDIQGAMEGLDIIAKALKEGQVPEFGEAGLNLLGVVGLITDFIQALINLKDSFEALEHASDATVQAEENYLGALLEAYKARNAIQQANQQCEEEEKEEEKDDKQQPNGLPDPAKPVLGDVSSTNSVGSYDPNDKVTVGAGSEAFIAPGTSILYTIHFENLSSATAPAQQVVITDRLDPNLDWSSLEIVAVGFNGVTVEVPPGLDRYQTVARVASDPHPVRVEANLDLATGLLTWRMASEDPATGDLPEDPLAGFLPPNDTSHRGEGYVSYLVHPKAGLPSGTKIRNSASITFDINEPIVTNQVANTIDGAAPTSRVAELPGGSGREFPVSWSGTDDPGGSGIARYDIYVSADGGPFQPWITGTADTQAVFRGEPGHQYSFASVATDMVGNRESGELTAEASTRVGAGGLGFLVWLAVAGVGAATLAGAGVVVVRRRTWRDRVLGWLAQVRARLNRAGDRLAPVAVRLPRMVRVRHRHLESVLALMKRWLAAGKAWLPRQRGWAAQGSHWLGRGWAWLARARGGLLQFFAQIRARIRRRGGPPASN